MVGECFLFSIPMKEIFHCPFHQKQQNKKQSSMTRLLAIWLASFLLTNAEIAVIQGHRQLRRHRHSVHIPTYSIDEVSMHALARMISSITHLINSHSFKISIATYRPRSLWSERFTVSTFQWYSLRNQRPPVAAMIHHPNSLQVVWPHSCCCCSFLVPHPRLLKDAHW
jgi:hypothetical protein